MMTRVTHPILLALQIVIPCVLFLCALIVTRLAPLSVKSLLNVSGARGPLCIDDGSLFKHWPASGSTSSTCDERFDRRRATCLVLSDTLIIPVSLFGVRQMEPDAHGSTSCPAVLT